MESKSHAREDRLQGPMRLRHRDEHAIKKQMALEAMERCSHAREAYVECAKGGRSWKLAEEPRHLECGNFWRRENIVRRLGLQRRLSAI